MGFSSYSTNLINAFGACGKATPLSMRVWPDGMGYKQNAADIDRPMASLSTTAGTMAGLSLVENIDKDSWWTC